MKLTRDKLKKIIKEELEEMMSQNDSMLKQIDEFIKTTFPFNKHPEVQLMNDHEYGEAPYIIAANGDEATKIDQAIKQNFPSVKTQLVKRTVSGPYTSVVFLEIP